MSCAACDRRDCAHIDLVYAGLFPSSDASRRHDDGAPEAAAFSFHGRAK